MRIWEVVENDTQIRFYFYATKKEAQDHYYRVREENREHRKNDPQFSGTVHIDDHSFPRGRTGLVKAMNWVITMTCFNDG